MTSSDEMEERLTRATISNFKFLLPPCIFTAVLYIQNSIRERTSVNEKGGENRENGGGSSGIGGGCDSGYGCGCGDDATADEVMSVVGSR